MIAADLIVRARDADVATTVERLGVHLKRVSATERAGACPVCGGTDRFAINIKRQVWHWRGCGKGGDVIALVQHMCGIGFREAVAFLTGEDTTPATMRKASEKCVVDYAFERAAAPAMDSGDNREKALALWRESVDPRGTVVERYLASRKLDLDDGLAGEVLRWHPRIGAMLALFRGIRDGRPRAISRTFLDREGRKVGRRFFGSVKDAAVMLDPAENVLGELRVGEGVESTMAARALGLKPAWALGSAGAIAAFPLLAGAGRLFILGENDANGSNARAVEACAARWGAAGREVILIEPIGGKDMNDVLANGIAP